MNEAKDEIPAALPLILFVAGLTMPLWCVNAHLAAAGFAVTGGLLLLLRSRHRMRLALLMASIVLGYLISHSHASKVGAAEEATALLSSERFVTIEATTTRAWKTTGEDRYRLDVGSFLAVQDDLRLEVDRPLMIFVRGEAPHAAGTTVIAEGFLRPARGDRYALQVKSTELVSFTGEARRFDPRFWNRSITLRLEALSGTFSAVDDPLILRGFDLARALALGQSDAIPYELRRSYVEGGTYHLLVFSGMQIAFAAALLLFILRLAGFPLLGDWMLLGLSLLAPLFAGNEVSVGRASWMIGLYAFARILRRPTPLANLLFVSAMIRLSVFPEELTNPGFALTYAATGGMILVGTSLAALASGPFRLLRAALAGISAELAVAPLTLFFFHRMVMGGSIVTLLIGPVMTIMLALSALLCVAAFLLPDLAVVIAGVLGVLDSICQRSNAVVAHDLDLSRVWPAPPLAAVIFAFAAVIVISAATSRRWRALAGLPLLLPVLISVLHDPAPLSAGEISVEALNVGQGDAIVIRSGASAMLVDGGGRMEDPGFGERVLLPMLLRRGLRRFEIVAMSHAHLDHCGGLPAVVRELDIGELWLIGRQWKEPCSQELFETAIRRGIPVVLVERRERLTLGRLEGEVITPRLRFKRAPLNNGSVVFRLAGGGMSVLLTGDIEKEAEREIAEDVAELQAAILKVGHHGSKSSTTETFLAAVRPRFALISAGEGNPHGHPHPEVVERLEQAGVRLLRTDQRGSVEVLWSDGRWYARSRSE
jgi:competence protein ComEC